MYRHPVAFIVCGAVAAIICALVGGKEACISSLCASLIYILPSGCIIAVSRFILRQNPEAGSVLFQIGLLARSFVVIGLMLAVALTYDGLCWPAFIFTLFLVASAPMAGQFFIKQ